MSVTRWDPFRDLYDLQRAMTRVFDEGQLSRRESVGALGDFFAPVNVYETEDAFTVQAEVPGMKIEVE